MNELFELFLGPYGIWKLGALLIVLYFLAYAGAWFLHWGWLWVDDKETPPQYNLLSATWWKLVGEVKLDSNYPYRTKTDKYDGGLPFFLPFVFIFVLCMTVQFWEVAVVTLAVVFTARTMRGARRIGKKLSEHIADPKAHSNNDT